MALNIVIPMAGLGSRFAEAGYELPKPLIDVGGRPMILRVIDNLTPTCEHRFIFVCQRSHFLNFDLDSIFSERLGNNWDVVLLDEVTDGAARTVLAAQSFIDNSDPLLIANSDQFVDCHIDDFLAFSSDNACAGLIMSFSATDPKWSYARTTADGYVDLVVEKKVISNNATVGIYLFGSGNCFVQAARDMIAEQFQVSNEYYVAPCYNYIIRRGLGVRLWEIHHTQMYGLGTPVDLEGSISRMRINGILDRG